MRQNLHLFVLIVLFFLPACTIQKRLYRGGWHVEWRNAYNRPGTDRELVRPDRFVPLDRITESVQSRNTEDSVLTELSDTIQEVNQPKETIAVMAAKSEFHETENFKSEFRKMKPVGREVISVKRPSDKYYWSRSTKAWSVVLLVLFTALLLLLLYFGILSTEFVLFSGGLILVFLFGIAIAVVLILFFVLFFVFMARPTQESIDKRNVAEKETEDESISADVPDSNKGHKSPLSLVIIGAFMIALFLLIKTEL